MVKIKESTLAGESRILRSEKVKWFETKSAGRVKILLALK